MVLFGAPAITVTFAVGTVVGNVVTGVLLALVFSRRGHASRIVVRDASDTHSGPTLRH
jgi:ABC-type sulfate transport system permease component